jgi:hypothetical protein
MAASIWSKYDFKSVPAIPAIKNPSHMKEVIMSGRELLIKEINGLPDFIIDQLLGIVRYVKMGIENEYVSKSDNVFYNSDQFKNIVSGSIREHQSGKTEDMDTL